MATLHGSTKPPPGVGASAPVGMLPPVGGSGLAGCGRLVLLFLTAFALGASGGCHGNGGTTSGTVPLRTDVEWQLESFTPHSGPAVQVMDPSLYTVRFGVRGTVNARADCNRCAGSYRVAGASLTIGPLACTLAACPIPTLGDQFTAALTRVSSYVQTSGELVLIHDGGTLRFRAPE